MATDLDAIKAEWLNQCGPCDYGMPEYGCSHPTDDYRPVLMELVREVEQLRALTRSVGLWGANGSVIWTRATGFIWRRPGREDLVLDPTEVTVMLPAVCPDPDGHRREHEGHEVTIRARAEGKPLPEVDGQCPYCRGGTA